MTEVVWTDPALDDLEAIRLYIKQSNPQAAERLVAALLAAGNSLNHSPFRGRPVSGTDLRELVASRSYVIRYLVEDEFAVILRVRHTARRPVHR